MLTIQFYEKVVIEDMNNQEMLVTESMDLLVLTESASPRPGCLGVLSGPIADYKDSTRNKRFYSRKLWEKVFNTPWVIEALETKTLFGEVDHPLDRLETKIQEAAVVLTRYSFDDKEQCVRGDFDILDTPKGRILKALADYGCKLGVSSRGRGKVNNVGNRQVVDENQYLFGGFDVVALPAVKKARQDYVSESVDTDKFDSFAETVRSQINESCSANDLMVIRNILESTDLPEMAELTEAIDSKIGELSSAENDNTIVIEGLTRDLKSAYETIEALKASQSNTESANTISHEEYVVDLELMRNLINENAELSALNSSLRNELSVKSRELSVMRESIDAYRVAAVDSKLTESANESLSKETELKLQSMSEQVESLTSELATATESRDRLTGEVQRLEDTVQDMTESLRTTRHELSESNREYNELVGDYNVMYEEYSKLLNNHVKSLCSKLGIGTDTFTKLLPEGYTLEDVDRVYESQLAVRKKLSKLPIVTDTKQVVESVVSKEPTDSDKFKDARRMLKSLK